MKILSIIKTLNSSHGGPPEVLKNQINIVNKNDKIINVLELEKLSIIFFIKCLFFRSRRIRIYNFLKKFDIIHFHEIWNLKVIIIAFFAKKIMIKFFYVGHGYLDPWSIKQKYYKKILFLKFFLQPVFKSSFCCFFSTLAEYKDARKNLKLHDPFIIPNGLSLIRYKKRTLTYKKKKKILFFGRIHKKKGLELLVSVINKLPADFFDEFSFEITGPGLKKDIINLKNLIEKNSLDNHVRYNSPVYKDNKIEYIKKHDVFILPSFEEGDSIALKEALGSYLPAIISEQCRLDVVSDYNAGIVIKTNQKSLFEALIKLKSLDIVKMGYNARKLVEEKFDNEDCSGRLKLIYDDIFNGVKNSDDWINQ